MSDLLVVSEGRAEALSALLAQAGPYLHVGLRTDANPITAATTFADLTELVATWYAQRPGAPWSAIAIAANGDAQTTGTQASWTNNGTTTPTITGYFIYNTASDQLYAAVTLAAAFALAPGQSYQLIPTLNFGYCAATVSAMEARPAARRPRKR
jgi:hypothetical protein